MSRIERSAGQALSRDSLTQESFQIMLAIGKLAEAVVAKAAAGDIKSNLATLVERIGVYFTHEERAMDRENYAGRRWHKIVHADIMSELQLAVCRSAENAASIDRDFLVRIRSIFIQHTEDDDIFKAKVKMGLLPVALPDVHPADLADVIEDMDHEQRLAVFGHLERDLASDTLEEVEPAVQRALVSSMDEDLVAELVEEMTPAQAADLLTALAGTQKEDILPRINAAKAGKIRAIIDAQAEHILNYATTRYISLAVTLTVGETIGKYRELAGNAAVTMYIYVTSPEGVLLGVVDAKALLLADHSERLSDVMAGQVISLGEGDTMATAAKMFSHYGFGAIPVVDADDILKGVIPARDIMRLSFRTD